MKTMKFLVLSLLATVALGNETLNAVLDSALPAGAMEMATMFESLTKEKVVELGLTEDDAAQIATCIATVSDEATKDISGLGMKLLAAVLPKLDVDKLVEAIGDLCEGDGLKRILLALWGAYNKAEAATKLKAFATDLKPTAAKVKTFKTASATAFKKFFTEDASGTLETGWTTRKADQDDVNANPDLTVGEDAYFHTTEAATGQTEKVVKTTANEDAFATLATEGKIKRAADKSDGSPGDVLPADQQDDPEVKDLIDNGILDDDLVTLAGAGDLDKMGGEQEEAAEVEKNKSKSPAFLAGAGVTALLSLLL